MTEPKEVAQWVETLWQVTRRMIFYQEVPIAGHVFRPVHPLVYFGRYVCVYVCVRVGRSVSAECVKQRKREGWRKRRVEGGLYYLNGNAPVAADRRGSSCTVHSSATPCSRRVHSKLSWTKGLGSWCFLRRSLLSHCSPSVGHLARIRLSLI